MLFLPNGMHPRGFRVVHEVEVIMGTRTISPLLLRPNRWLERRSRIMYKRSSCSAIFITLDSDVAFLREHTNNDLRHVEFTQVIYI